MEFLKSSPKWTRQPKEVKIDGQKVIVTTEKGTDLWARTYYILNKVWATLCIITYFS